MVIHSCVYIGHAANHHLKPCLPILLGLPPNPRNIYKVIFVKSLIIIMGNCNINEKKEDLEESGGINSI